MNEDLRVKLVNGIWGAPKIDDDFSQKLIFFLRYQLSVIIHKYKLKNFAK